MPGFVSPQYTQTPNDLFDLLMRDMEKSELKVVLAVIRKTLGFHTKVTRMSMREIQEMTGLSSGAIYAGVEAAAARGLLIKINKSGVTEWRINWNDKAIDVVELGILVTPEIPTSGTPMFRSAEQSVPISGTPSIKESLKEREKKKDAADAADAQKQRVKTILEAQGRDPAGLGYLDEYADTGLNQDRVDVSQFPEPYRITIERFCRLWRVPVPEKVGGKSGAFGDWINGARDLMSAYAEYGPELLDLVYWGGDWIKDSGEPFTVARPAAVLKWTQARAAEMRRKNVKPANLGDMIEFAMQRFMKRANDDILQSAPTYNERAAKRRQAEQNARARTTKQ